MNIVKQLEAPTLTNQSILVSRESGAGKTVTTKVVLHYFAMLSKQIAQEEQQLRLSSFSWPSLARMTSTSSKIGNSSISIMNLEEDIGMEQQVLQSNPTL